MPDEMKDELWCRWRAGESISVISRGIGKPPGSVFTVLKYHGGIAPAVARARPGRLTRYEREEISRGLSAGATARAIAAMLGRPASTISREITRNGGRDAYRAIAATARAREQARRPKLSALQRSPLLRQIVVELLDQEWSPEQIAGRLRRLHPDDPDMAISHESIYRAVYISRWKVIPRELSRKLRTGRPIRKNKRGTVKGQWRSQITGARPIEQRGTEADGRLTLGHLEGDLIIGAKTSQVATLVDRKSRYLFLVAVGSRHTGAVVPALVAAYSKMDARFGRSLTWDRGMELAAHAQLFQATGVEVFFAAPAAPGSAAPTRTPTSSSASTCPKAPTSAVTTRPASTSLPPG
jgi:IS30 family transposase